ARGAAKSAETGAQAADQASIAAREAGNAAKAAISAGGNAVLAADAAVAASNHAAAGDRHAAEARAAAATARRHAGEATRAAEEASALAFQAADAAAESRDAARSAAAHANASAKAADEAAQHAGEAAHAAARSTEHAKNAQKAADAASRAVAQARKVHTVAQAIEAAELRTRTNAGIEHARDLKIEEDERRADQRRAADAVAARKAEIERLAAEASAPGADPATVAAKGRALAVQVMREGAPWSQMAAEVALAGSDADVLTYVRTGWRKAIQEDERAQVERLALESEIKPVRDAAEVALKGDTTAISAFLAEGQYRAGEADFRIAVTRLIDKGGAGVRQAGLAAMASSDTADLRTFLRTGQHTAREADNRVNATQLLGSGGPEVKAAARIAMEGPTYLLSRFSESGQHMAQRKDRLTATHVARVQHLIAGAAVVAAKAQQSAALAGEVAAIARRASAEAAVYAQQAKDSAAQAQNYADQAKASAKDAEASAAQAAESARVARAAEADAHRAANNAAVSAADATLSAEIANTHAAQAWESANQAKASAIAAGKDAEAAEKAALDTFSIAVKKLREEEEARRKAELAEREKAAQDPGAQARAQYRCGILGCEAADNPVRWCMQNEILCQIISQGPALNEAMTKLTDTGKELLGLGELEECANEKDLWACGQLMGEVAVGSKLKLLDKAYDSLKALRRVPCTNCFLPGTQVVLGDGTSTEDIQDIRVGEKVLATDPYTGVTGAREVTRVIVTDADRTFSELTVATRDGPRKLTATHEHLFWSPSAWRWVEAQHLTPGTTLRTDRGEQVTVSANRSFTKKDARTYTLTVKQLHTFYVTAGRTPVLVHNAGCDEFAEKLHQRIGGEIWTITPKGFPVLGPYKLANEDWGHHTFVIKDGRVYDQFTGAGGMPLEEWKTQWDYPDLHEWKKKK
ncbi:polymorphic toxin-type HINT domain-containing protein, partial [Streptomyces sp. NPDC057638]|uniref:polymorphic toxin-type HINT domain-containing protein n=1 Tax=Streptomyces sp. NPDC057638 TaxID=3346190 RepID=UPI0036974609